MVDLRGGDDGLSTLAPIDHPVLNDLRPRLAVAPDEILGLDDEVGLHPALTRLHARGLTTVDGVPRASDRRPGRRLTPGRGFGRRPLDEDEVDWTTPKDGNLRVTVGFDRSLGALAEQWLGVEAASVLPGQPSPIDLR